MNLSAHKQLTSRGGYPLPTCTPPCLWAAPTYKKGVQGMANKRTRIRAIENENNKNIHVENDLASQKDVVALLFFLFHRIVPM